MSKVCGGNSVCYLLSREIKQRSEPTILKWSKKKKIAISSVAAAAGLVRAGDTRNWFGVNLTRTPTDDKLHSPVPAHC